MESLALDYLGESDGCPHIVDNATLDNVDKYVAETITKEEEDLAKRIAIEWAAGTVTKARPLQKAIYRFFKQLVKREVGKLTRNGTTRLFSSRSGRKVRKADVVVEKTFTAADKATFLKICRTYGVRSYKRAGKKVARKYNGEWEIRPEELDQMIATKNIALSKSLDLMSQGLEDTIREVLVESSQAEPRPGMAQITQDIYARTLKTGVMSPARAERIARTEIASYENGGIVKGYKVSGIKKMRWLTILDGRARPGGQRRKRPRADHIGMNMATTKVGQPWLTPYNNTLMYPGDPNGAQPEIINCRCTTMPVIERKKG